MEEVALQNLAKTRANVDSSWLAFAPRAFLQIFITTTLHHRLLARVAHSFVQLLRIYRQADTI
jgi:hypothetical protein